MRQQSVTPCSKNLLPLQRRIIIRAVVQHGEFELPHNLWGLQHALPQRRGKRSGAAVPGRPPQAAAASEISAARAAPVPNEAPDSSAQAAQFRCCMARCSAVPRSAAVNALLPLFEARDREMKLRRLCGLLGRLVIQFAALEAASLSALSASSPPLRGHRVEGSAAPAAAHTPVRPMRQSPPPGRPAQQYGLECATGGRPAAYCPAARPQRTARPPPAGSSQQAGSSRHRESAPLQQGSPPSGVLVPSVVSWLSSYGIELSHCQQLTSIRWLGWATDHSLRDQLLQVDPSAQPGQRVSRIAAKRRNSTVSSGIS